MEKPVKQITQDEWTAHQVWEYDLDSEGAADRDETWMRPVELRPVSELANRVISVPIQLANGAFFRGLLGNIDLKNPRKNRQFISVSLFIPEGCFHLVRDSNFESPHSALAGTPDKLAALLNLPTADIFPLAYDLTGLAIGHPQCIQDSIPPYPAEKLTNEEQIKLALSRD